MPRAERVPAVGGDEPDFIGRRLELLERPAIQLGRGL